MSEAAPPETSDYYYARGTPLFAVTTVAAFQDAGAAVGSMRDILALFPGAKALLAIGDVAIKAVNCIAKRNGEGRVIPAGSTYRIRGERYTWRGARVLPSYLQAGPSLFIEKSKRRMIAEDIAAALREADGR